MGIDVKSKKDKKYEGNLSLINDYFNKSKKILNNATFGLIPGSNKELLFENSEINTDEFLYLPKDEKLKDLVNVYKKVKRRIIMNQTFDKAFELVLKYEGGYVNDPDDPGGETKYGICKRQYPNLDIKNLTKEQAKEIYRKDYWDKIKGDDLPPRVAVFLMQCAVNIGVRTASKMLQRATKTFLKNKPSVDGIIGSKTIAAVKQVDEDELLAELTVQQCRRYTHLCIKNPKFAKYIKGWLRRTINSMQFAIKEV